MKIVVLVKHVPEPTAAWRYAEDLTLDRANVDGRLSELDEYAVEQAVALVEKGLPATITYLTMGPAKAVDGLRKALAMGGDDAVHVQDDALHGSDALATSLVLAEAIERIGFDLVLCGMASTDAEMSVVPAMVAERLGVPQLTFAASLAVADGSVTIRARGRRRDAGGASPPCPPWCRSPTRPARRATRPSRRSWPARRSPSRPGRWPTSACPPTQVGAARPRPPCAAPPRSRRGRPAPSSSTTGTAPRALADFLVAQKLL